MVAPEQPLTMSPNSSGSLTTSKEQTSNSHIREPKVTFRQVITSILPAATLLIVVFWINASQLWGLFLRQGKYTHRAHVALVDFDTSSTSPSSFFTALSTAAASTNGTYSNPTYITIPADQTSPGDIKDRVLSGEFWAAAYVHSGASQRFSDAVNGSLESYDPTDVYTYITLPARYFTVYASSIQTSVLTATQSAASIFLAQTASQVLAQGTYDFNSTVAISALTSPARAVGIEASKRSSATLDDKPFLNTVGTVFPILMQFFFIMAANGIANSMHAYARGTFRQHVIFRVALGTIWPLLASLCVVGFNVAFSGPFEYSARMFFAFWAVTWVFCIISFDVVDTVTGFLPMAFVPFFMLSWIIFSVSAALGPVEVVNQWYRIAYFFPSCHWWQTVITILTEGGVNRLVYNLPTLAGWLVVMKVVSPLAVKNRMMLARRTYLYLEERDALEAPH